jgi:hypothetical protein
VDVDWGKWMDTKYTRSGSDRLSGDRLSGCREEKRTIHMCMVLNWAFKFSGVTIKRKRERQKRKRKRKKKKKKKCEYDLGFWIQTKMS